jgi:hypothetical protein
VAPLAFLGVVLSDEVVEGLNTYYQRLVARDQDEAAAIVDAALQTQTLAEVYDTVLIPALSYAKEDLQRHTLTDEEVQSMLQATREIVEDRATHLAPAGAEARAAGEDGAPHVPSAPTRLVVCPARDNADALAVRMFQQTFEPRHYEVELLAPGLLTAEVVALVLQTHLPLLCIGAVVPGGVAHLRYLCKQLRTHCPALRLVVGVWGVTESLAETVALLRADGVDQVATTLQDTRDQVLQASQLVASLTPPATPAER